VGQVREPPTGGTAKHGRVVAKLGMELVLIFCRGTMRGHKNWRPERMFLSNPRSGHQDRQCAMHVLQPRKQAKLFSALLQLRQSACMCTARRKLQDSHHVCSAKNPGIIHRLMLDRAHGPAQHMHSRSQKPLSKATQVLLSVLVQLAINQVCTPVWYTYLVAPSWLVMNVA